MQSVTTRDAVFISATHYEHVRPMFKARKRRCLIAALNTMQSIYNVMLPGLSTPLAATNDGHVVTMCVQALADSVRISCIFALESERDTLVHVWHRALRAAFSTSFLPGARGLHRPIQSQRHAADGQEHRGPARPAGCSAPRG